MKVAYVCISHKPITSLSTGGVETFTIYLLNELKKLDCQITLFSAEETDKSLFEGIRLLPTFSLKNLSKEKDEDLDSKVFTLNYSMFQYAGFKKAMDLSAEFDIIHFSSAQWYIPFLLCQINNKVVTTIHVNNLRTEPLKYLLEDFKGPYIANISESTRKPFDLYQRRKTVYNGVDLSLLSFEDKSGDYVAWLGRVAPVKGLKEALLAARKADVNFIASGSIDFVDYFEKEAKPLLDEKRKFIGPVSAYDKGKFLSKAKAVLMPVMWDEPFGLVAIEAMACGTPVIAFRRGGLAETVIDGVTGYLVDSVEEMAEKIAQIDKIDRKKCRDHVEKNFSAEVMAKNYLSYYKEIIAS